MSVIDALWRIQRIREDACERALRQAREQLRQATLALQQASQQRADGDAQRDHAEQSLYAGLCRRAVRRGDLESARQEVDIWQAAAQADAQAEAEALELREVQRECHRAALHRHRQAMCASEKFATLAEQLRARRQQHLDRLAEQEFDECRVRPVWRALDEDVPEVAA